jgi:hypothetical protein
MVWLDEPLMMCSNCFNGTVGGLWRRVELPGEMSQIEAALLVRPVPNNRNWRPGETVEDLIAENIEHGLPGGV